MILPVTVESFQSYLEDPRQVLAVPRPCPCCKVRRTSRHGAYARWVYLVGQPPARLPVFRLRCRPCGLTFSLLPDFLLPYVRYAVPVVEAALDLCLAGSSCRAAAVAVNAVVLEPDASPTDALLWTRLAPGYQRVHAWLAAVARVAADDVMDAAAWLARRKPGTLAVDLLAVPLGAVHVGAASPARRAGFAASRMLVRLFGTDPDLDPAGRGWLRAWCRFAMTILLHHGWCRPPPEPHGS